MLSTGRDSGDDRDEDDGPPALFATETMAELYVRQGKVREALPIFRHLLAAAPPERQVHLRLRLEELERRTHAALPSPAPRPAPPPPRPAPSATTLVVSEPVRSGQLVEARGRDLIVLGPVNPGGQLIADGHIHVYGPLRGFAVAGAAGRKDARLFCHRLEAQVVGIADRLVCAEEIPAALRGRAVQVCLRDGRCEITPL